MSTERITRMVAALAGHEQEREDAARLEGYTEAEEMIAEGLRKLAEAEDVKAWLVAVHREIGHERHLRHEARAACLREAALAVSVGQFRDVPKGDPRDATIRELIAEVQRLRDRIAWGLGTRHERGDDRILLHDIRALLARLEVRHA